MLICGKIKFPYLLDGEYLTCKYFKSNIFHLKISWWVKKNIVYFYCAALENSIELYVSQTESNGKSRTCLLISHEKPLKHTKKQISNLEWLALNGMCSIGERVWARMNQRWISTRRMTDKRLTLKVRNELKSTFSKKKAQKLRITLLAIFQYDLN